MKLPKIDGYATHLPVLAWAAKQSRFHIPLEYGCGFYSTAVIQALRGESVESVLDWYKTMKEFYPKVILESDWTPRKQYSFVFVDSFPEESRYEFVKKYQHLSTLWLLHDAVPQWEHAYGYERLKRLFPYSLVVGLEPQTLILSQDKITYEGI